MENVQRFCGLPNNGSFIIWESVYETFGKCFLWTSISYSCHAVLAIVCAYCFGVSKRFTTKRKPFMVIVMNILTLGLATTSLTELVLSYVLKHEHPPAYVLSKTLSFSTWLFCFCIQWQTNALTKQKKENTKYILTAFLFVMCSSSLQLHFVIKHMLLDKIKMRKAPPEYIGIIVYFSLNVAFLFCCIGIVSSKIKRTSFNRSLPSLTENVPSIQVSTDDTSDERTSLLSSGASQNVYYDIYTQRKKDNTDIYLGKAESKHFFSNLFFLWSNPLMLKGYHGQLENPDDLFILPDSLDTSMIKEILSSMLRIQKHRSLLREMKEPNDGEGSQKRRVIRMSLMKSLHKAFGKFYYSLGVLKFFYDGFGFAGPILLNLLINFMENKQEPMKNGYYYALGLFLSTFCTVIMSIQYQYYIQRVGLQVRAGLITTIYEKTLSANTSSLGTFSNGQIMNLMSTDTDRVVNFCNSFHEFWSMPFQVAVCLFLLYKQVGIAFLTGLGFIILLIPINRWIANKIGYLSKEMMKQKDERVQTMSEILFGIRIIKMFAWEPHFQEKIDKVRKMELKSLKGRKYLDALCVYFWATTPVLISLLTFATYILLGNQLTAAKVFTSIALFNMLIAPLNAFPWVLNGLMEAWVSLIRIEEYLNLEEINLDEYYIKTPSDDGEEMIVEVENGSFRWQDSEWADVTENPSDKTNYEIATPFELKNVSLFIKKGQFIGITGKVGAGKSTLFASITAELEKYGGCISLPEDFEGFAHVAQESWIQHMSIRDNILFGSPYDSERYQEVLFACALNEDLNVLAAKDLTEVGENGVTLSGGQKARISLARAVYQDKEIYLLDDPIAAVDAHVALHLFKYCIMGLLKDKTRLLCTHHKKYLEQADHVILLENGTVIREGLPEEVLQNIDVEMLIDEGDKDQQDDQADKKETLEEISLDSISVKDENGKLIEEEKREKGAVSYGVYKAYWISVGNVLAVSVLMFLFLMQASRNISDWWLAYWVSHSKISDNKTVYYQDGISLSISQMSLNIQHYLTVFACIGIANSVLTFLRAFLFAYGGIVAARCLHEKLLTSILKAPISFFDVTPIGRIINRFSSDTYSVDDGLPFIMNIFFAQAFGVLGTIVITCYGIPWFTLALVPLGAVYYFTQNYYRRTSRELKRLSTVTLSPVYEHFSETLSGLMTIRAFHESHRFISENERKLDFSQRSNYAGTVASIWLIFRLNMIAVAMVTSVSFLAVFEHHHNTINPGLVGLAVTYALSITWKLSGLITAFTETEKQMVCVERVVEYINDTPKEDEGTLIIQYHWPHAGEISFSNVGLQYRKGLPLALESVTLKITAGEKIGICGRTGSGKTSLFQLLFKLIPLTNGEIIIDGVNIQDVKVSQLRSEMSIIPQDPFLYNGTIADNLDPKKRFTSFEMVDVLAKCHLTKLLKELGGLDGKVGERGQNLSCGQKQLLCLGRALIRKSKIICIDEATASVDHETDQLIQLTIRKEFSSSTVLTIAHRIETIMDSDRILVMGAGQVVEFAPPDVLLSDHESAFSKLVLENNNKCVTEGLH